MPPSSPPRPIHEPQIYAALAIGLSAGFGLAAVLVAALAFNWLPGEWSIASIQAHGHAQLFEWAGLFVLGLGFSSAIERYGPRSRRTGPVGALVCLIAGISLHAICQPPLVLIEPDMPETSFWTALGRLGLGTSGLFELAGVAMIILILVTSYRRGRPLTPDSPIVQVRPFLAISLVSLGVAVVLNAALALDAGRRSAFADDSAWDDVLTRLMIIGFILPMAFALSLRKLPLFMRLAFPLPYPIVGKPIFQP